MKKRRVKKRSWYQIAGAVTIIVFGLIGIGILALARPYITSRSQQYGVTFSQHQAKGLGLDWKETYQAILSDLGVKHLRLVAYWDIVEPRNDTFDFADLDYQMDQAALHDAQVILTIGRKVPRWPECFAPPWAASLSEKEQQEEVLDMLAVVVQRYKAHPALRMWQLENEPLLDFGICPPADPTFLRQEELLVRELDPDHLILVTDSGELNWWIAVSDFGDGVGTTMYRTVFSQRTEQLFHYDYIFPAWMYRLKSRYIKLLRDKEVIIVELQGEPWGAKPFPDMTAADRDDSFSLARFKELLQFAQRTQLSEAYWWGVEYWYWEKSIHNRPQYWEMGKSIFDAAP
ncbi:MAG: beta-galactosidase [Candidatus Andersenbacteria bacterium]